MTYRPSKPDGLSTALPGISLVVTNRQESDEMVLLSSLFTALLREFLAVAANFLGGRYAEETVQGFLHLLDMYHGIRRGLP